MRVERQALFWLAAALAALLLVGLLRNVLLPFVAGLLIAYFLNPLVDALSAWRVPRIMAAAFVIVAAGAAGVAFVVFVSPLVFDQGRQFAAALPGEIERLEALLDAWARERLGARFPQFEAGIDRASRSLSENWTQLATWAAASLWTQGLAVFYFLSLLFVSPLVAFYLLVDWPGMLAKIDGWLPRDHAPVIRRLARDIDGAVAAFIRGQGVVCLVLGVFYAMALSAVGLQYGLLVGLSTGLLSFVPFAGWAAGLATACGLAFAQFWPDVVPILAVAGVFLAGQLLDAGFLSPKIVGSKIGLHPVFLILALFVFTYLFGVLGALVAVPLAAAIGVFARFAVRLYLSSRVYRGRRPAVPVPAMPGGLP